MGKRMKNMLSLTLALLLTVSLATGNVISVNAEDEEVDLEETTEEVVEDEISDDEEEIEEESPVQVYSAEADGNEIMPMDIEPDVYGVISVSDESDLNDAIAYVNDQTEGDYTISLQNDITLSSDEDVLTVDAENVVVTILGNGYTIDDEDDATGHVLGASNGTLNLGTSDGSDTLTITSNKEEHATALVYVMGGTVNMYDGVKLENNHVSTSNVYGGAVHVDGGTFNMYGGEIDNCSAHYGGAIAASGGTLNITDGKIDKDDVVGGSSRGSAIYVTGSNTVAYISNVTIENNEIDGNGSDEEDEAASEQLYGTLCFYSGCTAVLDNVTVQNNVSRDGGAIYINGSAVTVKNSTITGNKSVHSTNTNGAGGGIYATGSAAELTVDNCKITGNSATGSGGGILTNNLSYVTIKDSTISYNEAGAEGGGLRIRNSSYAGDDNFLVSGCTIEGNKTTDYLEEGDSTFVGGGGVFTSYVYGTITDCKITSNSSERGGVICTYIGGRVTVTGSTISGNEAVRGGGIYTHTNAALVNSEVSGNIANVGAGWLAETQVDYAGTTDSGIDPEITITGSKIVNNKADYSEDVENIDEIDDSGIGGGLALISGHVTADEGNVIANNTADIAAADIYVGPYHSSTANSGRLHEYEPTLSLIDAADMNQVYEADGKGQMIDGWYEDKANEHYEPHVEGIAYDGYASIEDTQESEDEVYLVASYAAGVYEVVFNEGDHGTLSDGMNQFATTSTSVKGGTNIVDIPEVNPEEGYQFVYWLGHSYSGNEDSEIQTFSAVDGTYTNDEIQAITVSENWEFTAVYEPIEEEPEGQRLDDDDDSSLDSGNGGNGTGLDNLDDNYNDASLSLDEDVDTDYIDDESDGEVEELSAEEAEDSDSVKTGDSTSMLVYIAGLGLSVAGLSAFYVRRKRNYND